MRTSNVPVFLTRDRMIFMLKEVFDRYKNEGIKPRWDGPFKTVLKTVSGGEMTDLKAYFESLIQENKGVEL